MRLGTLVLLGISALLVLAGFRASLGMFTIDEFVYFQGVDVFRTTGGFTFDNGVERFGSPDLIWAHFLPVGPNGQTTQYPPGMSILGGWISVFFDARGLIFLNVAATIGSLFVTRALALELFGRERVAIAASLLFLLGTFMIEYAYGYWPHAISVFTVNLSFLLFVRALNRDAQVFWLCGASGLVLGAGLHFRLDNILLLPVIGLATLLFATHWQQALRIALGGAVGLAPPVALLSAINVERYGTWNPLSYGAAAGGGTSLANYAPQLSLLLGLTLALVLARLFAAKVPLRLWTILIGLGAVLGIALVPQIQALALAYAKGVLDLIVDARYINDPRPGVEPGEGNTLLFWDLAKKSMGQSMPWLGILLALIGMKWREDRRSISLLLILVALWSMPFLTRSWHGGLGSNMRYFMPLLPALCLLGAWVIARLITGEKQAERLLLAGGVTGLLAAVIWTYGAATGVDGTHQILSTYVFLAVAAGGLLAGFTSLRAVGQGALLLTGMGLGLSNFNSLSDTAIGQTRRESVKAMTDLSQGFDEPVVVYLHPYRSALIAPDQYAAMPASGLPDAELVDRTLAEGLRVMVPDYLAELFTERYPDYLIGSRPAPPFWMVDIVRADRE